MTTLIRQEVRRLMTGPVFVFVLVLTWVAYEFATHAMAAGHAAASQLLEPVRHLPAAAVAALRSERPQLLRQVAGARLAESPLDGGIFAAGVVASLPGFLLTLWLAADAVASEWVRRTWKTVLTQGSSRRRVLVAKMTAAWLVTLVILLATWALLALAVVVARHGYPIASSLQRTAVPGAVPVATALAGAVLVAASFVVLASAVAVATRHTLGTLVAGGLLAGVGFAGAGIPAVARIDPMRLVAGAMQFGHEAGSSAATGLWTSTFGSVGVPSPGLASVALAAGVVALACGTLAMFNRYDIS